MRKEKRKKTRIFLKYGRWRMVCVNLTCRKLLGVWYTCLLILRKYSSQESTTVLCTRPYHIHTYIHTYITICNTNIERTSRYHVDDELLLHLGSALQVHLGDVAVTHLHT